MKPSRLLYDVLLRSYNYNINYNYNLNCQQFFIVIGSIMLFTVHVSHVSIVEFISLIYDPEIL